MTQANPSFRPVVDRQRGRARLPRAVPLAPGLRGESWWVRQFVAALARFHTGAIQLTLPSGTVVPAQPRGPGPVAELTLHNPRAIRRMVRDGILGFTEAYLDGDWDSRDLATLVEVGLLNEDAFGFSIDGTWLSRQLGRIRQIIQRNSRSGSARNIAYHYDLGNDFYRLWLDDGMTYSSALYVTGQEDLETAQTQKFAALARRLDLAPGMRVLEVGCGWGGFALHLARHHDVHVTALTISREQFQMAADRIAAAGLQDRIDLRLQDYRDVQGQFDRIASIEMFEAVGFEYWPIFFQTLRARLAPGGRAGLQVITVADHLFQRYRAGDDYIRKYIFPGGMLAGLAALGPVLRASGLQVVETAAFGQSYARTLAAWQQRFQAAWPAVAQLGFDARFKRLWEQYLAVCEGSFRTGRIDVVHLMLDRPASGPVP